MQTKTFPVHPSQAYRLTDRLGRLAKQAAKVGADFYFKTTHRPETKDDGEVVIWADVHVTWSPLVLPGGWAVAGVWDLDGGLMGVAAPGAPEGVLQRTKHRAEEGICDHCGFTRDRNKVIVVVDSDGFERIVGTTCVKDFLGIAPGALLNWLSWEETLEDMADEDWDLPGATSRPAFVPPAAMVAAALAVIRSEGYTPRSKVERGGMATADLVTTYMFGRSEHDRRFREEVGPTTDEDREAAERMIEHFADEDNIDATNDYLFSLHLLAAQDMVKAYRAVGYLTSMPAAYRRETEKMERRQAEKAAAAPIPVNGQRITVVGEIMTLREKEHPQYGVTLKTLVKTDAGWKVWGTVPKALRGKVNIGDRVQFDAKVEPSRDDATFGFFNRPTKASIA